MIILIKIQRMKMKVIKKLGVIATVFLLFILSSPLLAQSGTVSGGGLESVIKTMVAVTVFLVAIIMWLVLVYSEKSETAEQSGFSKLMQLLNQRPPIDDEQKLLLDHDFDGIRELNNKIPPWFMAIFYGSIIWALVYMVDFHILGSGNVQEDEYAEEVQIAAMEREILNKSGSLVNEESVTRVDDVAALASGKNIFVKNCAACHGMGGEGLVGPNFTDEYWIHGGGIKNIFKIIKYGVPQKGMISWQTQLDPTQMQEVGSYIMALRGTRPPNQKGPEGEKWDASKEAEANADAALSDKGVGPISSVEIPEEIDANLAKIGETLFDTKCSACHKINKRFVGPPLRGVTQRRSPAWIMNMILDPDRMVKENPAAKQLLIDYLSPMANQSLNQDEARAILEYFRTQTN
jgi:cytochrome c oxidase cbb3-type subunit III